jgi:hypothetical protein
MCSIETQKNKVKSLIIDAFTDVFYPGREHVCSSESGYYELEELLAHDQEWSNNWQNIPTELIEYDYSGLSFFSREGYQFFIPAYLMASIDLIDENGSSDSVLLMSVVYDFCCKNDPECELFEHTQYRKSMLSDKQRRAINAFLYFVFMYSRNDEYIELAKKTIDLGVYNVAIVQ